MSGFAAWAYAALVLTFLAGVAMPPSASRSAVTAGASSSTDQRATAPDSPKVLNVDFSDAQPIVVDRATADGYTFAVFVRNDGPNPVTVGFTAKLLGSDGDPVPVKLEVKDGRPLERYSATPVMVTISSSSSPSKPLVPPLVGYITLDVTGAGPGDVAHKYRAIKITPGLPSPAADYVLFLSIGAASLVVLISFARFFSHKVPLRSEMGVPTWSFGDSWGSNIAVAGAFLTQLLGLLLPEQTRYLNKTAYSGLSLIFGTLITVAPALYSLCRRPVAVLGPPASLTYQGYVWAFVVASGFTLWGAFGQLGTIAVLLGELCQSRQISAALLMAFECVVGALVVALFLYGILTMNAVAQARKPSGAGGGAVPAPPSWSLL